MGKNYVIVQPLFYLKYLFICIYCVSLLLVTVGSVAVWCDTYIPVTDVNVLQCCLAITSYFINLSEQTSFYFLFNPYPAKLLKLTCLHFYGNQNENLKLVSQQYRAWSDCTDVQTGLALYRW